MWTRRNIADISRRAESLGLRSNGVLGVGHDGVVLDLGNATVAKFTSCAGEAAFGRWLVDSGSPAALPVVYGVREAGRYRRESLWAVIREDVPDVPRSFSCLVTRLLDGVQPHAVGEGNTVAQQLHKRLMRWDILEDSSSALVREFAAAIDRLSEVGCSFPELHEDNWGFVRGQLVLRDLSRCMPPPTHDRG